MATHTIHIHRVLRATPERVYRAFIDTDALVKWLPPNGFTAKVHHMDDKVGGSFKMSFTNFTNGKSHSFARNGKPAAVLVGFAEFERIKETLDVLSDPALMRQVQQSRAFYASGKAGLSFEDVFGEPLRPVRKTHR